MSNQNEKSSDEKQHTLGLAAKVKIHFPLTFHLKDGTTVTKHFVGTVDSVTKETKDDDRSS